MTTDVAERTESQTETTAQLTTDTKDLRVTDGSEAVQTDTGSEQTATETPAPSRREQRLQALADAEREEERQRGRDEAFAELNDRQSKSQQDAQRERYKQSFPATMRRISGVLDTAINEGRLTTEEKKAITDAVEGHNLIGWEANAQTLADSIRDQVYAMLPRDAQEEMTKRTAQDTSLPNYFTAAVEVAAPHSKWAKSLDLETAQKASAKLRKELAEHDVTVHDEGYEEGLNAPAGTSPDGGRSAQRSAPGMKTFAQLEAGYGDGTNTAEEDRDYVKQRAERARRR